MSHAGITNETMIVCYDEAPYPLAAARLWWTLRYYGHSQVKILAGGIRKWVKDGRELSKVIPVVSRTKFIPKENLSIRATKERVRKGPEQ